MPSLVRSQGVFGELTYPNPRTLQMVVGLHVIESVAQCLLLAVVLALLGVALPLAPILAVILVYAIWNGLSWWNARRLNSDVGCEFRVRFCCIAREYTSGASASVSTTGCRMQRKLK